MDESDITFCWVGTRESDLQYTGNLFKKSITIFGSNQNGNISFQNKYNVRVNHNLNNEQINSFFRNELLNIIDDDIKLMFYNPSFAYRLGNPYIKNCICLNDSAILRFLSDKIRSRYVLSNYVPTLPSVLLLGRMCTLPNIIKLFPEFKSFIIQKSNSAGGYGTYILDARSEADLVNKLLKNESYIVSPYFETSIPVNVHLIICNLQIIFLTPSVQIIERSSNRLLYKGADFICYNQLDKKNQHTIKNFALDIAKILQASGYRGICGIDFLIYSNDIYFIEVNNRFQASSILLNRALKENNLPSVHELNLRSFYENENLPNHKYDIEVPYSSYSYHKESTFVNYSNHILKYYKNERSIISLNMDGLDIKNCHLENDSYLFRAIFNTNIVSISMDNDIILHDNIRGESGPKKLNIHQLKIRLLNQGCIITELAMKELCNRGGLREAVFSAIDMNFNNEIFVNVPFKIKLTQLSPFIIDYTNKRFNLYYYETFIAQINIDIKDLYSDQVTKSGIPFSRISKLATDRLRIHHQPLCYFKTQKTSCVFCDLPEKGLSFKLEDIYEVVDFYLEKNNFNHFLIGGGSAHPDYGWNNIIQIATYIKAKCSKNIYLMVVPPTNKKVLRELYESGIDEIGFNIEIFDSTIAKKYMPGKSIIPIEQYYSTLTEAVRLWGRNGEVRSVIILGLESEKSLLDGITNLCKIGVSPIISLFRPLPNTQMNNYIPLSFDKIVSLLDKINAICIKFNVSLGPKCSQCQNNTLTIL